MLDLLLQELLPFAEIRLFSAVFWYIDFKFGIWIGFDLIQSYSIIVLYNFQEGREPRAHGCQTDENVNLFV